MMKLQRLKEENAKTGLTGMALSRHMSAVYGIVASKTQCSPAVLGVKPPVPTKSVSPTKPSNNNGLLSRLSKSQVILMEHRTTGLSGRQLRIHCIGKHGAEFKNCSDSYFYPSSFNKAKLTEQDILAVIPKRDAGDEAGLDNVPGDQSNQHELAKKRKQPRPRVECPCDVTFCPRCGLNLQLLSQALSVVAEWVN